MSKKDQLVEFIIQDVLFYMGKELGIAWDKAMQMFYQSSTFEKLQDAETGMYLESSAYVYDIFTDELKNGKIVQMEF